MVVGVGMVEESCKLWDGVCKLFFFFRNIK